MNREQARPVNPSGWHREWIKAAIREKGETLTSLAVKNGLHREAVRDALRTGRPEAEAIIAKFIKVPAHELWPSRYRTTQIPENGNSSTENTPKRKRLHRQIAGAA